MKMAEHFQYYVCSFGRHRSGCEYVAFKFIRRICDALPTMVSVCVCLHLSISVCSMFNRLNFIFDE